MLFMNVIRCWIAVPVFSVAALLPGFGCATQSEKPKAVAQTTINAPTPPPVPLATNAPPPPATIAPPVATTPPVYVPDLSHANEPMPDGVLAWDSLMQTTNADADQAEAHFVFKFTNVARAIDITLVTNISTVTNITVITNSITPTSVTVLSARASCGCTQPELPPRPWTISPGANGQIGVTVNLAGKSGTIFKWVDVSTDKGTIRLYVRINILLPVIPTLTDEDRAMGVAAAKVDRQAIFHGDCATCHIKQGVGKYGKALFDAVCAVCHEAEHRATMVPDLHNLKVPTSNEFWRTWIAHGRAGSLMPAFSTAEGGALTDMQVAELAAYLDMVIPNHVPLTTNAPAVK
jgi:mono/diheme cytochrome c family protein